MRQLFPLFATSTQPLFYACTAFFRLPSVARKNQQAVKTGFARFSLQSGLLQS